LDIAHNSLTSAIQKQECTMSKVPKGRKPASGKPTPNKSVPNKPVLPDVHAINATLDQGKSPQQTHLLVLLGLSILLYANTLSHDFALDDAIVITDNMHVQKGWAGLMDIFNKDTFHGFFKTDKQGLLEGGRYRPFTLAMFAVELSIFGKSPFWGHLFNLLWYALTGIVLYLLSTGLFAYRWNKILSAWLAFAVALIFIAHPLHTEAVANIKGRDEIMALLGCLAALYFSLRSYHSKQIGWEALAVLAFLIGIFSKENAITFLAVVPLTYWFFTDASVGKIIRYTAPFLVVALVFLLIRSAVLPNVQIGTVSRELMNNPFLKLEGTQYVPFTGAEKQATVFYTLGKYLQLFLAPYPLTHDYYPMQIPRMDWSKPASILSFLLYLGMGIYGVLGLRKKSPIAYGFLFYLSTLSIVSNLFLVVGTNMSERLVFMPSVGLCIALVAGLADLFYGTKLPQTLRPQSLLVSIGALALVFGGLTIMRNPAWKNNLTLFRTDAKTSKNSAKVHNALGGQLVSDAEKIKKDSLKSTPLLEEAAISLQRAVELYPGYKDAFFLLGTCNIHLKKYPEAVKYLEGAYSLNASDTNTVNNLTVAYRLLGQEEGEKRGNLANAFTYLKKALTFDPNDYATLRLLGVASNVAQDFPGALSYFEKAKNQMPQHADAWFELGMAYQFVKDNANAQQAFAKAQQLDPDIQQKFRDRNKRGGQ
jgi:protein O-mannosyl-transferase